MPDCSRKEVCVYIPERERKGKGEGEGGEREEKLETFLRMY